MKEIKKEINRKENTLASKGKGKGNDWKNQKNHDPGKQLDTIVYPQTNHTIAYHDHSCFFCLAETNPLESLWFWLKGKLS